MALLFSDLEKAADFSIRTEDYKLKTEAEGHDKTDVFHSDSLVQRFSRSSCPEITTRVGKVWFSKDVTLNKMFDEARDQLRCCSSGSVHSVILRQYLSLAWSTSNELAGMSSRDLAVSVSSALAPCTRKAVTWNIASEEILEKELISKPQPLHYPLSCCLVSNRSVLSQKSWCVEVDKPPNLVTIANAKKCLLTRARYECLLRGSARALLIQMRMVEANHWTEQVGINGGVREKTEDAEVVCNPIGRTTISTNQNPCCSQGLNHQPKSTYMGLQPHM
ncbi:LRRGT00091 [Rattus norvegicus]|uniref:LRRGT00091 n=2 Tax=Rattus norvegicus TaxID=10116 RepID=A6HNL8_RAT|nr:LRRGT00091 [Rattus norvegicus]EDL79619.1 LRRGT00091 [Rattus norvegicus]|eukprot:NP_001041418.1 uncharacterized protein LOC499843 [Rattus norvegicus]